MCTFVTRNPDVGPSSQSQARVHNLSSHKSFSSVIWPDPSCPPTTPPSNTFTPPLNSYLAHPDDCVASLDVWHLAVRRPLFAVEDKEGLGRRRHQVLSEEPAGDHHPVGSPPGPGPLGQRILEVLQNLGVARGQIGKEQVRAGARGGHHHVLVGLDEGRLEGQIWDSDGLVQFLVQRELPLEGHRLYHQPGALGVRRDYVAAVRRHERLPRDVQVGADDGVGHAVDEELGRSLQAAPALAPHKVEAAQVGVGHADWDAAVVLQADGLDAVEGLQVDLVHSRLVFEEDEGEPGRDEATPGQIRASELRGEQKLVLAHRVTPQKLPLAFHPSLVLLIICLHQWSSMGSRPFVIPGVPEWSAGEFLSFLLLCGSLCLYLKRKILLTLTSILIYVKMEMTIVKFNLI